MSRLIGLSGFCSAHLTSASSTSSTVAPSKTGVAIGVGFGALITRPALPSIGRGPASAHHPGPAEHPVRGRPAEVRLEDLADVHAARHAERVQQDVDGAPVLEERHVLLGHDFGNDALVAMAAGELVALRDLALLRDVDADEFVHAR